MNDQAMTLREMAKTSAAHLGQRSNSAQKHACTIAITGGKGGVGKSNVAVNLAIELAVNGRRVSLLDADLALANADVLLGLNPKFHLGHVLAGEKSLAEVVIETEDGVRLIPAGSGIEELANLPQFQQQRFIAELSAMEDESDFLIIDTPAGIGHNVTSVMSAASAVIIVTTPDPTAIIDAYATLKVLHQHSPSKPVWVVVNDVVGIGDAEQTFGQIQNAAMRFLRHPLTYIGTIPRDPELAAAVREQVPVINYAPQTPASRAIRLIARWVDQARNSTNPPAGFWQVVTQTAN